MYEDGLKQIGKGEAYFEKVLSPLSGVTTENWTYKGLVFFPNIDSRDIFIMGDNFFQKSFPVALDALTKIPISNFKGNIRKISQNHVKFEEKRVKLC